MIRTLLTTTALTVLLATGAIAQDAAPAAPAPATVDSTVNGTVDAVNNAADAAANAVKDAANATGDAAKDAAAATNNALNDVTKREPWDVSAGYVAADTDNLATRLIGQSVFSSTGDDAEDIGKVTDLVFDANGDLTAAIIGVGGFLGIGEKSVAVDFHALEFTVAADNTERWVLPTSKDALTNAPDFVWAEDKPADAGAVAPAEPAPVAPAQ